MKYNLVDTQTGRLLKPEIILSLSGGAARGYMFVGVHKVLEELGIGIKSISGTSMGSIIGMFIAMGKSNDELVEMGKQITVKDFADINFSNIFKGLFKGKKLHALLQRLSNNISFDELSIPFYAVTTLIDGRCKKKVVFKEGCVATAVLASASNPLFCAVEIDKRLYCDGYHYDNLSARSHIEAIKGNAQLESLPHLALDCLSNVAKVNLIERIISHVSTTQKNEIRKDMNKGILQGRLDYILDLECNKGQICFDKYLFLVDVGEKITRDHLPEMLNCLFGMSVEGLIEHNRKLSIQNAIT